MREIVSAQQDHAWMDYLSVHPDCARQRVSWKNSLSNGVAEKVDELLRAAMAQQKALRQDLVLVPRHKQAEAEFECLFGKLGGWGGYGGEDNAHGFEAGRNVSLSKGIKSDGPIRQIAKRLKMSPRKTVFNEKRRILVHARVQLANAESEFALALTAYLGLLSSRILEATR
jgi:hypothetical protein